jgi:3-isopropylmalate/(R)-2-methylmalate dehydratase large subunit
VTFEYLSGRPFSPRGRAWEEALARWRQLSTDEDAHFEKEVSIDVSRLEPMITFGTNPGMAIPITAPVPNSDDIADPQARASVAKALRYMDLIPGKPLAGLRVDVVFIGSCTNGRISDLRLAASLLNARKVHPGVRLLVVPGSQHVKKQAEAEGLDRVFLAAGAEWRQPGCSMCIAMNGDELRPGQYCVSTSNRNFEGRQGKGGRTLLASPLTAAATAVIGKITDPRTLL